MDTTFRPLVLIVEDDRQIAQFLAENLRADGIDARSVNDIKASWRSLQRGDVDLMLVDLQLPDGFGLDLVEQVRNGETGVIGVPPDIPVIALSGLGRELDRVRGFERGVDDYVTKPFSYLELRQRIEAVLRRATPVQRPVRARIGPLEIDPIRHAASVNGKHIRLSTKEFALLRVMAAEPTRVYTKHELMLGVWGYAANGESRTLDSHVTRLRRKLSVEGVQFVVTVWGVGYKLFEGTMAG